MGFSINFSYFILILEILKTIPEISQAETPVRREIMVIIFSRLVIRMVHGNFFGVTLVPIQSLPIFSKLLVELHVPFAPRLVFLSMHKSKIILSKTPNNSISKPHNM